MNSCKCDNCGRKLDCESWEFPVLDGEQILSLCDICYLDWKEVEREMHAVG